MAKTKTKRKAHASVTRKAAAPKTAAPDVRRIREQAAIAVLRAVPEIIQGLIDKAAEGNHLPAKFIFDFAGLTDAPAAAEADAMAREVSLAELFLRKLQGSAGAPPSPADGP
jgi:hypothetical protein